MTRLLAEFLQDLRFGARLLLRNKLLSAVATLSLALGIGGAASVFTLLNAVAYRTLPVSEPERLYSVAVHGPTGDPNPRVSWPAFQEARDLLRGRADLCATTRGTGMQVREGRPDAGPATRGFVQLVSGECFDVMRQRPQMGRLLTPSDNTTLDGHPVAVISDAFWTRQHQRNPSAVGSQLVINGTSFTVVGVTAPGYFGPYVALRDPDVWMPLVMQHTVRHASNADNSGESDPRQPWPPQAEIQWLEVFGRLAPGETPEGIAAVLTTRYRREAATRLDPSAPDEGRARIDATSVRLASAARGVSRLRDQLDTALYVLLAMVCVLVAIASGNVASLLLARAGVREREMAIRLSIGAGRVRLVRQLLAETLLLSALGGGLGLIVAAWGRDILLRMFSRGATIVDFDTSFDWRVITFLVGITALTGLATGLLPALRGTRVALADALKRDARTVGTEGGRRGAYVAKGLVAAQIAFCLLLLVVSGLFMRTLTSLLQVDVGYDRARVLTASLDIRSMGHAPAARQALYERIIQRVEAIPGVESASLSANGPFGGSQRISSLSVEGYTPGPDERMLTNEEIVTEAYFRTVGLRIVEGRGFAPEDRLPERRSTIVSESMARRYFGATGAIGRRWDYGGTVGPASPVIVGVVEDAKYIELRGTQPSMAYHLAAASEADVLSSLQLRTALRPADLTGAVRQALNEIDSGLPIVDIVPFEDRLDRGVANEKLVAQLTSTFGVVALMLACLGLYGTVSYGVTRRVSELGVRMALGAERRDVLWLVLREALVLVTVGAIAGIPLAYLAGRSLASFLYGVAPADPAVYAGGTVVLLAAATLAAVLPAHRASRIDPMVALRKE